MDGTHRQMTAGRRAVRLSVALVLCIAAACGTGTAPPGPAAPQSAGDNAGKGAKRSPGPARSTPPATIDGSVFPPRAGLSISPPNPDIRTGVRASPAGFPPPAKPDLRKVRWFINGSEMEGDGDRLAGKFLRKGDTVTARAEVRYRGESRVLAAPAVTVRNTLPEIQLATLSPLAPRVEDTVRVEAAARDPDGDAVSYRVRWFADDNEVVGETSSEISLKRAGVRKGSWIHAEVHARDDADAGTRLYTPKVMVVNSPPVVARIAVSPGAGNRFAATVTATDADGDPVTVAATSVPAAVTLTGNILSWDASNVPPGEELPVVLRVSDGDGGDVEYAFRLSASRPR